MNTKQTSKNIFMWNVISSTKRRWEEKNLGQKRSS